MRNKGQIYWIFPFRKMGLIKQFLLISTEKLDFIAETHQNSQKLIHKLTEVTNWV